MVELGRQVFVERVVYFDRPERHVRNDQVVPIIGDALLFETLNPYGAIRIECPQDASGKSRRFLHPQGWILHSTQQA